ncbi:MAG: anhydro-N-acetylmuramic acid kinase [Pseudomonadota bacterium]
MTDLFVGVMSGTSLDGLDLALLLCPEDEHQTPQTIATGSYELPAHLRNKLLDLALSRVAGDVIDILGYVDAALGQFYAGAITNFLQRENVAADQITAIGCHGQTIRHRPQHADHAQDTNADPATAQQLPFTMQIGDPHRIAELTGIATVADFRRRDVAAGGQGAPLVPPFHAALFADPEATVVVANIGGISNITVLNPTQPVSGYDTGPGNCLLDEWVGRHLQQPYDADGSWAANGQPDQDLLQACLADPYFAQAAPKSTGREYFNLTWLESHLTQHPQLTPNQVQATLVELTAQSLAEATASHNPQRFIVCGGGRHNGHLMQLLEAKLTCPVLSSDERGVDGDYLEAAAFAWLAACTVRGKPSNAVSVTGARGPRILGAIYPGSV